MRSENRAYSGTNWGDKCEIKRAKTQCRGENWGTGEAVETRVKLYGPERSKHPECTGRQVGDKREIMPSEETNWETSAKSCG